MKHIKLWGLAISAIILVISCCGGSLETTLDVCYTGFEQDSTYNLFYQNTYGTDSSFGYSFLKKDNQKCAYIQFDYLKKVDSSTWIFELPLCNRRDTISNISIEYGGKCKGQILNATFIQNGVPKSGTKIEIRR